MSHFYRKHVLRNEAGEGGEDGGGNAEVMDVVAVVKDEGEAQQTEAVKETEQKARKMGWVPKDEFRGDPEKWRPADEFVDRGENMVPIMRATMKKQEREIAELKQTMQQFAEYHSKTEQRAYQQALADLKAQQAAAVAAGDGARFAEVGNQIEELKTEIETKNKPKANVQEAGIPPEEFNPWLARNPWANDRRLQNIGKGIAEALIEDGETARGTELLDLVAKEIKRLYPEKFENPRRNSATPVEGAGNAPRKSGKGYADLPQEAKEACDRFVKQGLVKKDDYVKQFFAD